MVNWEGAKVCKLWFYFPHWQVYFVAVGWLICTVNGHHDSLLFGLPSLPCQTNFIMND
jgi:hypothetical protein